MPKGPLVLHLKLEPKRSHDPDDIKEGNSRPRTSGNISYDVIYDTGHSFLPARYFSKGPSGGRGIVGKARNHFEAKTFKLVDVFDVIRPKSTKNDPAGSLEIQELRAGNITSVGGIEGDLRHITVRPTKGPSLEAQIIKEGDILFAHRGPIGRVAYVADTDLDRIGLWASQTLLRLKFQMQHQRPFGHRMLRWTDKTSTSVARTVA